MVNSDISFSHGKIIQIRLAKANSSSRTHITMFDSYLKHILYTETAGFELRNSNIMLWVSFLTDVRDINWGETI